MQALLDFGCSRDLISPVLVTGLQELDEVLMFEQMDGSPIKGEPCTMATVPALVGMGKHWETRSFMVTSAAKYSVLLRIKWLMERDPHVRWGPHVLCFADQRFKDHK